MIEVDHSCRFRSKWWWVVSRHRPKNWESNSSGNSFYNFHNMSRRAEFTSKSLCPYNFDSCWIFAYKCEALDDWIVLVQSISIESDCTEYTTFFHCVKSSWMLWKKSQLEKPSVYVKCARRVLYFTAEIQRF